MIVDHQIRFVSEGFDVRAVRRQHMIFVTMQDIFQGIIAFAGIADDATFELDDIFGIDKDLEIEEVTDFIKIKNKFRCIYFLP